MFKKIKEFQRTAREDTLIAEIISVDTESVLRGLSLNTIKSRAARMVFENKISADFYKSVFLGGDISHPYWEVNADFIVNYAKEKIPRVFEKVVDNQK